MHGVVPWRQSASLLLVSACLSVYVFASVCFSGGLSRLTWHRGRVVHVVAPGRILVLCLTRAQQTWGQGKRGKETGRGVNDKRPPRSRERAQGARKWGRNRVKV